MENSPLEQLFLSVQKPGRYSGGEMGSVYKDKSKVDVRFAFCFPDTYEIGMSHLGMKILYHLLNEREDTWCERVFAPWPDMEEKMRERGEPLFSIETKSAVRDFDFVGFTLMYEMCYSNVINMLDLSGVPVLAADRGEGDAFVCAGGACAYNGEPLADFIDFFSLGEGEESTVEIVSLYDKAKAEGWSKDQFLLEVSKISGVYVPSFYEHHYNEDGTLARIVPLEDVPTTIVKRIVEDLDKAYFPTKMIVPSTEIVHDRANLEVFRGCIRGCRWCRWHCRWPYCWLR